VIQVASFASALQANRLVQVLRDQGYRAYPVEVDLGARGLFRRVLVGRYRTLGEAESDLARIREIPGHGDARILNVQPSHLLLDPR
jgi:cell division septation protein DedD